MCLNIALKRKLLRETLVSVIETDHLWQPVIFEFLEKKTRNHSPSLAFYPVPLSSLPCFVGSSIPSVLGRFSHVDIVEDLSAHEQRGGLLLITGTICIFTLFCIAPSWHSGKSSELSKLHFREVPRKPMKWIWIFPCVQISACDLPPTFHE